MRDAVKVGLTAGAVAAVCAVFFLGSRATATTPTAGGPTGLTASLAMEPLGPGSQPEPAGSTASSPPGEAMPQSTPSPPFCGGGTGTSRAARAGVGTVAQEWTRLRSWAAAHAPTTAAALVDGRPVRIPRDMVTASGGDWPTELVAWFRLQDGVRGTVDVGEVLMGYTPLSAAEAREEWWSGVSITTEQDKETQEAQFASRAGDEAAVYDPRFVPIASDGTGGMLVVDLRPGPKRGHVTDFAFEDGTGYLLGDDDVSIAGLLHRTNRCLTDPTVSGGLHPAVQDGRLRWTLTH